MVEVDGVGAMLSRYHGQFDVLASDPRKHGTRICCTSPVVIWHFSFLQHSAFALRNDG